MRSSEAIAVQKPAPDLEIARGGPGNDRRASNDEDILRPLQILLATRCSMRNDPSLASLEVPEDQAIVFSGPSGVEAAKDSPIWAQVANHLGYMHFAVKALITFLIFGYSMTSVADYIERRNIQNTHKYLPLLAACYISSPWILSLILARVYVKRNMTTATPPSFDPQSYEYRLTRAMRQRGMSFREVVTNSQKQMEGVWAGSLDVREIFRIEGLVDPKCPEWAYDILVKFWKNAQVEMQFAGLQDQKGGLTRAKRQIVLKGRSGRVSVRVTLPHDLS